MLANAFGPEGAKRIAEHLPKGGARVNKNIESLQKADPQQLSRFIESEHPQTIALILVASFSRRRLPRCSPISLPRFVPTSCCEWPNWIEFLPTSWRESPWSLPKS